MSMVDKEMMQEALRCSYREDTGKFCLALHQAQLMRLEGKKYYSQGLYIDAIRRFTDAAESLDRAASKKNVALALTNRSIVCAKLNWWAESYADAMSAIRYEAKSAKAWFRAGIALEHMGVLRPASAAYYRAIELDQSLYSEATPAIERCRSLNIQAKKSGLLSIEPDHHHKEETTTKTKNPFAKVSKCDPLRKEKITKVGKKPRVWFGLGPGRCGLHSLAALVDTLPESSAAALDSGIEYRQLLWDPSEPRSRVIRRKVASLRARHPDSQLVGDLHFGWLPYLREIARLEPQALFVVIQRNPRDIVESWFYWTEAGSRRQSGTQGDMPVFSNPKDHWRTWWKHRSNQPFDFDEWDLTLPRTEDTSVTKRQAILQYVTEYYEACRAYATEIGTNRFHFCEMDHLFAPSIQRRAKARRELFEFLHLSLPEDLDDDDDYDEMNTMQNPLRLEIHQNKQRYIYNLDGLDDEAEDFEVGDLRRLDPNRSEGLPSKHQAIAPDPSAPKTTTILVPPDAKPGDTLRFRLSGQDRTAVVPATAKPGDRFTIPRDALDATSSVNLVPVDQATSEHTADQESLEIPDEIKNNMDELKRLAALVPKKYVPGQDPFGYDDSWDLVPYDLLKQFFGDLTWGDLERATASSKPRRPHQQYTTIVSTLKPPPQAASAVKKKTT